MAKKDRPADKPEHLPAEPSLEMPSLVSLLGRKRRKSSKRSPTGAETNAPPEEVEPEAIASEETTLTAKSPKGDPLPTEAAANKDSAEDAEDIEVSDTDKAETQLAEEGGAAPAAVDDSAKPGVPEPTAEQEPDQTEAADDAGEPGESPPDDSPAAGEPEPDAEQNEDADGEADDPALPDDPESIPEEDEQHEDDPVEVVSDTDAAVVQPAEDQTVSSCATVTTAETVADPDSAPVTGPATDQPNATRNSASIPSRTASILTGALIGIFAIGATMLTLTGCEAVRGTSSCGQPGFFLVVAILLALILIASKLLQAWKVPDPTATSVLGVGLLTVVCLLFLIDVLLSPWMIVVIPVVGVVSFLVSNWVTENYTNN